MSSRRSLFAAAWPAAVVLCLAAMPARAQSDAQASAEAQSELARQHFATVRARYGQAGWPRGELRGGLANELALPGWARGPLQSDQGLLSRSFRRADADEAAPSFVLETFVADSVSAAQETLVSWLAGLQSNRLMPSALELGLEAGEAGFVGRSGAGPKAIAWIAFVRGNVAVRITACDPRQEPGLDLAAIARSVDEAITAGVPLSEGAAVRHPEISDFAAERASAVAGGKLRLDLAIADPGAGEPHLQWVVGGPGQGYVERAPDGGWVLHPTGPGTITLCLEVTGSNGTFAQRSIQIDVADD